MLHINKDAIKKSIDTPVSPAQVKKKKTWDAVAKELKMGDGGGAKWSEKELRKKEGVCGVATL